MADLNLGNPLGYVEPRNGEGLTGGISTSAAPNVFINGLSVEDLKTALAAAAPASYTAARLESMTLNDLLYAYRQVEGIYV